MKMLFVHDAHVLFRCEAVGFSNASFHLFLRGFCCNVFLSAPCEGIGTSHCREVVEIDKVTLWLRPGYGRAIDFYLKGPKYWFSAYKALSNQFQAVDIVIICGPCSSAILAYLAAKEMNKPMVAYFIGDPRKVVESSYEKAGWIKRSLAKVAAAWEWWVMKRIASKYAAVTLGKEIYQEIKPISRRIIQGATSLVAEQDVCEPKKYLGDSPLRILTACRLSAEKGIEYALEAIATLVEEGYQVQYNIAGDGPAKGQLMEKIKTLGLSEQVQLLGKVPYEQLKLEYRRADIFVLPSLSEGVPKVLFEAMAAGIPIVATNVGGVGDVLGKGQRGWLCRPGDPSSLDLEIKSCLADAATREMKLQNAYKYILTHTREAQARKLENFIEECFF